ncbi:unnamed protein product [Urochloa humidicola]
MPSPPRPRLPVDSPPVDPTEKIHPDPTSATRERREEARMEVDAPPPDPALLADVACARARRAKGAKEGGPARRKELASEPPPSPSPPPPERGERRPAWRRIAAVEGPLRRQPELRPSPHLLPELRERERQRLLDHRRFLPPPRPPPAEMRGDGGCRSRHCRFTAGVRARRSPLSSNPPLA